MKNVIKECYDTFKGFNLFSKNVFTYGHILILSSVIISLVFYIFKGKIAGYYESVEIYTALLEGAKQCVFIVYLSVIISEKIKDKI